jgi:hypothetical protein
VSFVTRAGVRLDLDATTIAEMQIPINEKIILKNILLYLKAIIFRSNYVCVYDPLKRYLSRISVKMVENSANTMPVTGYRLRSL